MGREVFSSNIEDAALDKRARAARLISAAALNQEAAARGETVSAVVHASSDAFNETSELMAMRRHGDRVNAWLLFLSAGILMALAIAILLTDVPVRYPFMWVVFPATLGAAAWSAIVGLKAFKGTMRRDSFLFLNEGEVLAAAGRALMLTDRALYLSETPTGKVAHITRYDLDQVGHVVCDDQDATEADSVDIFYALPFENEPHVAAFDQVDVDEARKFVDAYDAIKRKRSPA